jgi:cytochrome b6-f complex iron-sulfur subunit
VTRIFSRLSRRAILKISLSLAGLLSLQGLVRFLSRAEPPPTRQQFTLGFPGDYPIGSVTTIPEARALLLRDEVGLYALSSSCTHLGCTLGTEASSFECPCHGSRFNQDGLVVRGPASRPLTALELTLTPDGRVLVDAGTPAPPDQRLAAGI